MDNVINFVEKKAQLDAEISAWEDAEFDIAVSMAASIDAFTDRMVETYSEMHGTPINPAFILINIISGALGRAMDEANNRDNPAANAIFAWLETVGAGMAEDMDLDTDLMTEVWLDQMHQHRDQPLAKH